MKKIILILFLLIVMISTVKTPDSVDSGSTGEKRTFKHIILVTFDGARKYWIDALIENGTLTNLVSLKKEGSEITLRIVDHTPSTDPGIACIESGYGPDITGIDMNYFDSSMKPSVPEGLTTSERIKAVYGDKWKTALIMPWTQGRVNVTGTMDSTLWNQKKETDYWFSSENVTWSKNDPNVWKNALDFYSALLNANYTATKAAEFIRSNKGNNFYLRTHFTEPDTAGHGYSESVGNRISIKYKQALIECDEALGLIIDSLKKEGIYNETVILVSTDHGFRGIGHGGLPYPFGDPDVTQTWLISNDPEVTNELRWGLENDISPTCLGLAGIDPSVFQPFYDKTSKALPIWKADANNREVTPPLIYNVSYSTDVHEGEVFNVTARIQDQSGINTAQIRYLYGTIWRSRGLNKNNETSYSGSLGPFGKGTEMKWYLFVVDNSTSLNMAYYPQNGMSLTFTIKEPIAVETIQPIITDVKYSEPVLDGETFNITLKAQDDSGIASIGVYYSSDSNWKRKELTLKANGVYEAIIGSFNSGTEVRWYLNATDNSVNHNMAFYPSNKQPIVFVVKNKTAQGIPFEFLILGGALIIIVILIIIHRFRSGS